MQLGLRIVQEHKLSTAFAAGSTDVSFEALAEFIEAKQGRGAGSGAATRSGGSSGAAPSEGKLSESKTPVAASRRVAAPSISSTMADSIRAAFKKGKGLNC